MPPHDAPAADGRDAVSTAARRVRTRFAPSPTGMLHIGGFRTALFSFLLARRFAGDFILRIEDTDQSRLVPGALESIIGSLKGMGIMYDEGPDQASVAALSQAYGPVSAGLVPEFGGAHGPYFQSQRLPRYREVLNTLLESGKAYYAFETKDDLETARAAAEATKTPYRYDRKYRDYPLSEARARVAAGEAHSIRFKMPVSGMIRTVDALRGPTDWDAETQDDFIILKGDGFPPYHLAATVDDHDMEISHVLRGEEWLSSFPKHVCIFAALDWELPVFVHTPSVLGPDGKKLSKRNGAKGVDEFLAEGFLRESLVNYLALVGWSPGDDSEIMPVEEIIAKFGIDGISPSPAMFDPKKLAWINETYVSRLTPDEIVGRNLPALTAAGLLPESASHAELEYARAVLRLELTRIKQPADAPETVGFFFPLLPYYLDRSVAKWLKGNDPYLKSVNDAVASLSDWSESALEEAVRAVGAETGREKGAVTHPVRVAVSGREAGPGLYEMMAVLGRERVLARLSHAVELARG